MRGKPLFNWPAFYAAADTLRAKGHEVVNPAEIDEQLGVVEVERSDDGRILNVRLTDKYDLEMILGRDLEEVVACDGIVMLDGWHLSEGARKEHEAAVMADKKVFYGVDKVPAAVEQPNWWAVTQMAEELAEVQLADAKRQIEEAEIRVVDPETGGAKGSKLARFDLLPPDAMWAVAEHFGLGARKYEDRNWEKGYAWGLSYAALQRHLAAFWAGEDIDEESGGFHLAAAAVHCLFLLAFQMRGIGTDDRSKTL